MRELYKIGGIYVGRKDENFVIGYKPVNFHDVTFAPMINPLTNEKIDDMKELLSFIDLSRLFNLENKKELTLDELKKVDSIIKTTEFEKYFEIHKRKDSELLDCVF